MDFRHRKIDIVGKQNLWFGISLAAILIGIVSWGVFGLNLGIDFKGGGQLKYLIPAAQRPTGDGTAALIDQTRRSLASKGLDSAKIQVSGGDTLVIVTDATDSASLDSQERLINSALQEQFKAQPENISRELVGPVIGQELKRNAVLGVLLGVVFIAAWIYIRYNFAGDGVRYAVAGIVALVHDVIILVGAFALIGRIDPRIEIDGTFIAALLTVVGYSINDSVVIFDRIRENMRKYRKEEFHKVVNDSLLETMSRSINTGLTVVIMLVVMLMLGGESIYNFVLAMLIGIMVGMYSSIFVASMVVTAWHDLEQKRLGAPSKAQTVTAAAGPAPLSTPRAMPDAKQSTPPATSASTNSPTEQRPHKARTKRRF